MLFILIIQNVFSIHLEPEESFLNILRAMILQHFDSL